MNIIYPFPVLHPDTLDYNNPEKLYSVEFTKNDRGVVTIEHKLQKGNLVASLVEGGKAVFYGTVCARGTIFRNTCYAKSQDVQTLDNTCRTKIEMVIPSFSWGPRIIACGGVSLTSEMTVSQSDALQVSSFLTDNCSQFHFKKNSMIAFSGWMELFSMLSLFRIHSSKDLEPGEFTASTYSANHLRINITMHPKLFDEVEQNMKGSARAHVLCTALANTLKEIHTAYKKPDGELEANEEQLIEEAESLQGFLIRNDIPTWEDNDFNAALTASMCYKVLLDLKRE